MKKIYSNPEIMFEDFTLNESIAGDCGNKTHTPAQMECGLDFSGIYIFLENVNGCNFQVKEDGYNGFCYHVPSAGQNFFNS